MNIVADMEKTIEGVVIDAIQKNLDAKPGWIPVADVEKKGRILAISWRKGVPSHGLEGCWSDPTTYTWDEEKQYFACRRRGICIWPQYMRHYVCVVLPDLPPARD